MKKKAWIIIGVLLLCIGIGGTYLYHEFLKPDPEVQQELTDQFGDDFFTSFDEEDLENPETDDTGINNTGTINEGESIAGRLDEATENEGSGQGNLGGGAPANPGDPANNSGNRDNKGNQSATQNEIKRKYESKFNKLQNVAISRLDTLYSSAVQEYKDQKKAGTLDTSKLAQKYIQAGTTLEGNLDSEFYSALSSMESELKANNLSTDIINVYKNQYENMKSSKRSEMLSKMR